MASHGKEWLLRCCQRGVPDLLFMIAYVLFNGVQ